MVLLSIRWTHLCWPGEAEGELGLEQGHHVASFESGEERVAYTPFALGEIRFRAESSLQGLSEVSIEWQRQDCRSVESGDARLSGETGQRSAGFR